MRYREEKRSVGDIVELARSCRECSCEGDVAALTDEILDAIVEVEADYCEMDQ